MRGQQSLSKQGSSHNPPAVVLKSGMAGKDFELMIYYNAAEAGGKVAATHGFAATHSLVEYT